jgi:four helix bundle protein
MLDAGWACSSITLMSYRNLEVWQLARALVVDVHRMSLTKLPKFEMFEEGAQIRRSMKSVRSNLVEGYGRRRYKQEFIRYLVYSQASCDETVDHLDTLFEPGSLCDEALYRDLSERLNTLGRKLNQFTQAVDVGHRTPERPATRRPSSIPHPAPRFSRTS